MCMFLPTGSKQWRPSSCYYVFYRHFPDWLSQSGQGSAEEAWDWTRTGSSDLGLYRRKTVLSDECKVTATVQSFYFLLAPIQVMSSFVCKERMVNDKSPVPSETLLYEPFWYQLYLSTGYLCLILRGEHFPSELCWGAFFKKKFNNLSLFTNFCSLSLSIDQ